MDIHESLSGCELELVVLVDVVSQARIDQCYYTVQYVVLERGTNYFILGQNLVIIPLNSLASSGGVIDDMGAI